ncbi:MAG: sodium:proton antiporter [Candidatus Fermentibacteraceae bacterium]
MIHSWLPYVLCILLFSVGVYAILSKKNLIRIIMGIVIAEYAVNLFLILLCWKRGGEAPILQPGAGQLAMVDPLPQALVLTSIVIGLATTAFLVAIAMRLHERYGTYDITRIRELRG